MTKFLNKKSCFIGKNVKFGKNVTVYENNHIDGDCFIDDNTSLLPNNFIIDSKIGQDCKIHNSVVEKCQIENNVSIGPFARLRPGSIIKNNCQFC